MQFRSLQATSGGASYIISLPKGWVEGQKLEKGRALGVVERADGALVVYPHPEKRKPKADYTITMRGESIEELLREIIGSYVDGANSVVIRGDIPWVGEKALAEWLRNLLLGASVSGAGEGTLVVTIAIDEEQMPPQKALRRAHNISYWMYKEAVSQIAKGEATLSADITERDKEVDRLYVVGCRGLNRAIMDTDFRARIGMKRREMSDHFRVMDYIELIADYCCVIAGCGEALSEHKLGREEAEAFESLATEVGGVYRDGLKAFFTKDAPLSNKVIGSASKMKKEDIPRALARIVQKQKNKEAAVAISDALGAMLSITDATKHISELNIDRCARKAG